MKSFRTELENSIVEKDIIELEKKIYQFNNGNIDEEKFRSLRLARGVYGQRQPGVQMIRIKIPFGKVTPEQLRRIAEVSDEYSNGHLHVTTRQDIQIHYVSLDRTPELWRDLERDKITLREACGNAVRNVTASYDAGINPNEPFDVTPYAQQTFEYFLRNPVGGELGRKFKIGFSSDESDSNYTYINDVGLIPVLRNGVRGFKLSIAGGLGAQPALGIPVVDFIRDNKVIPYIEALLRVFDRYGERNNRNKARLKHLVKSIGTEELFRLINEEYHSIPNKLVDIDFKAYSQAEGVIPAPRLGANVNPIAFHRWKSTNVIDQKQPGFYGVRIKLNTGDFDSEKARSLAALVEQYAAPDIRFTITQGIFLRFVHAFDLEHLYVELEKLGFADVGAESAGDITACPGTDTCNLGISNSTGVALALEGIIKTEFPQFEANEKFNIKISGCMNSCGQHSVSSVGLHGSTVKVGDRVAPALQVLLGGEKLGNGLARYSERVIKIPSKRAPQFLRTLLSDFELNSFSGETFGEYFIRKSKKYFYDLLKPIADTKSLTDDEFIDWGHSSKFVKAIGTGECAGVQLDLVATLFLETEERLEKAGESIENRQYADANYHHYRAILNSAKALLLSRGIQTNSLISIVDTFNTEFSNEVKYRRHANFEKFVFQLKDGRANREWASEFREEAIWFHNTVKQFRTK